MYLQGFQSFRVLNIKQEWGTTIIISWLHVRIGTYLRSNRRRQHPLHVHSSGLRSQDVRSPQDFVLSRHSRQDQEGFFRNPDQSEQMSLLLRLHQTLAFCIRLWRLSSPSHYRRQLPRILHTRPLLFLHFCWIHRQAVFRKGVDELRQLQLIAEDKRKSILKILTAICSR